MVDMGRETLPTCEGVLNVTRARSARRVSLVSNLAIALLVYQSNRLAHAPFIEERPAAIHVYVNETR